MKGGKTMKRKSLLIGLALALSLTLAMPAFALAAQLISEVGHSGLEPETSVLSGLPF